MTESENTEECQNEPPSAVCQRIRINGIVQGVGFRPLVWRLARELELSGWVRNDSRGVEIEVFAQRARTERQTGNQILNSRQREAGDLSQVLQRGCRP